MITFHIEDTVVKEIKKWLHTEVYPQVIARQKERVKEGDPLYKTYRDSWSAGEPYTGAIGGGISYTFSSTGIGETLVVKFMGYSKDFTDYDNW